MKRTAEKEIRVGRRLGKNKWKMGDGDGGKALQPWGGGGGKRLLSKGTHSGRRLICQLPTAEIRQRKCPRSISLELMNAMEISLLITRLKSFGMDGCTTR
ncbi:hypothetical protein CEXT_477291 [Caerostris extrusa]|uniref:Uncharacterized protein n=1 Tax=Caerostris extrusa TaxID=172846 RepID=A0AAV4VEX0_CAEEX|nr:hypothetical protein CEXT_477291 [Caerostris extrusa]